MQMSDRARRALFGEPAFFLRSRHCCRLLKKRCSLTVLCVSSASAESHVDQGENGCVSVFLTGEALSAF